MKGISGTGEGQGDEVLSPQKAGRLLRHNMRLVFEDDLTGMR